jgi:molybdopterin-containing oxidoreductase family iron-sulfur binding subunit
MMTKQANKTIDLAEIQSRLAQAEGRTYWQSLEELADTDEFQTFLHNEFPHGVEECQDPVSRRTFLKLMGASMALAGLTGCYTGPLQPEEKIIPYVVPPPEYIPGIPLFFASTMPFGGYGRGVVVESHEGRPTKIEGNSKHPASLGSTDLFTQASLLHLYDPDRSQRFLQQGNVSNWEECVAAIAPSGNGAGLRILTGSMTSPVFAHQLNALLEKYPSIQWHQYEPLNRDNIREGAKKAFNDYVETIYDFSKADIVVSLDADFLVNGPGAITYARQFANRRRVRHEDPEHPNNNMNRLYVVESVPSVTGMNADHRLPMRADQVEDVARVIAKDLGVDVGSASTTAPALWLEAIVEDLKTHEGASIIIAGEQQPAELHALVHAMNDALGNVGKTIFYTDPVEIEPVNQVESITSLVSDMQSGTVDTLIIVGGNPVYDAPADLDFVGALANVANSVHLSLYDDETSEYCTWQIPEAHYLEAWGDTRAYDGTVSLMQPLISPLYGGKTIYELIAALMGDSTASGYDIVRNYWMRELGNIPEKAWEMLLQEGVINDTAFAPIGVSITATSFPRSSQAGSGLEVVFRPDPTLWDGSFANNGWLQELPKPISKVTWENVILVSPATAIELGLAMENIVQLTFNGMTVQGSVWVNPGQAYDSVTVFLGNGRTRAGNVGNNVGFDAYPMRTTKTMWFGAGGDIYNTGLKTTIASTQHHHSIEVRSPILQQREAERVSLLVKSGTLQQYEHNPEFIHEGSHGEGHPSIHPKFQTAAGEAWDGNSWAMVIDLSACIGCNACIAACNVENNIPIVGKEEVINGREMHWIRIDRYYHGDLENPIIYNQPLGCFQCEKAPCEVVCPVAATVHSLEGLNDMVYNRCVGTRYCANNCPYKVRRFNFFNFAENLNSPSLNLMKNPNVTVRTRGVMEKCSYCVQRINAARIVSKRENIPIADGEIVTACEAACPTQAITFGSISDPFSRVSKLKKEPTNYGLLDELMTMPRTTYLARLRNPNPKLEPFVVDESHGTENMHSTESGEDTSVPSEPSEH